MTHSSIKILLNETLSFDTLITRLQEMDGVNRRGLPQKETDRIYNLFSNYQDDVCLKYRVYEENEEQKPNLIFERADIEKEFRKSSVSVATLRGTSADTSLQDLFGEPDCIISKTRQIFVSKNDRLKVYLDTYHADNGNRNFVEIQLKIGPDAAADTRYISDVISGLGLSSFPTLRKPYAHIALGDVLPDEPLLIDSLGKLPTKLLREMMSFKTYATSAASRLLTCGEEADVAYMIMKGNAHVVGATTTLHPGQLVGEFGFLEGGLRTSSVNVDSGFEAKVLPPDFAMHLLTIPSYAKKYLEYKIRNSGLRAG